MRVLLICHYALPHPGGIETLVDREARLLADAGHEVVVLTSSAGADTAAGDAPGIRVARVPAWNGLERMAQVPWPVFAPSVVGAVWRHLRWCDVVHAHGLLYLNSALAVALARVVGRPCLLTEHIGLAWYPPGLRRVVQRAAMETLGRLTARLAGRCYGHHQRVTDLLTRLAGRGRVTYLANPLDRSLFRPPRPGERDAARAKLGWPPHRAKVLFVGRLIARKGIDLLLAARDDRFDLVFCGPGDVGLLAAAPAGAVEHLPPRPQADLVPLYHAADALAVVSRSEGGLVLVAQEALACGLPVVIGEDPGLDQYRGCRGLRFAPLTPAGVRRELHAALDGPRPDARDAAAPGTVPLDHYLPDERDWLDRLYGPAAEPGRGAPAALAR